MLTIFFCLVLAQPGLAVGPEDFGSGEVQQALPESARDILGQAKVGETEASGIFQKLWDYVRENFAGYLKAVLRPVVGVIAVAVICSVFEGMKPRGDMDYVNLAGCLAIAVLCVGDVNTVVGMGQRAIGEMGDFSRVLLPTLTTAAASAGAVSSAAAKYAATLLFLDLLLGVINNFVLPLMGACTAAAVAASVIGDGRLRAAVKLLKYISKLALTGVVTLFTAYLSITGIAASGVDAAGVKAARTAISTLLPVVGKLLSGASESLAAGAGVIRNTIGIFGFGAVLAMCAGPVLAIGLRYLLFKAAAAVAGVTAGDRVGRLVEDIGAVYGMVLGTVGAGAAFLFISILSMIKAVV